MAILKNGFNLPAANFIPIKTHSTHLQLLANNQTAVPQVTCSK
jgi:hypothetical protein